MPTLSTSCTIASPSGQRMLEMPAMPNTVVPALRQPDHAPPGVVCHWCMTVLFCTPNISRRPSGFMKMVTLLP